jgi:hypothetical protein
MPSSNGSDAEIEGETWEDLCARHKREVRETENKIRFAQKQTKKSKKAEIDAEVIFFVLHYSDFWRQQFFIIIVIHNRCSLHFNFLGSKASRRSKNQT